jgi:alkylated DNA repair dioxygenase AlkB
MERILLSKNSYLLYADDFIPKLKCTSLIDSLKNSAKWREDKIHMFGKWHEQPRKVAFYGDKKITYTYSKIKMHTQGWSRETLDLTKRLKQEFELDFNTCLLNLYRHGEDYMSWHQDNEPELGDDPIIASISLGQERDFLFREKKNIKNKLKLTLGNGSLLLMMGKCQQEFQHALPKRKRQQGERINLTFRNVLFE